MAKLRHGIICDLLILFCDDSRQCCHTWIEEDGDALDTPLDKAVLGRLKQFTAMNQFKKAAPRVIAGCLSEEEIQGLKEMFKNMDTENSGTITLEELKLGLAKQGTKLSESEAQQLMEAADTDGNGTIYYDEFITTTMHLNRMDKEEHLYTTFQFFDKYYNGFITKEELEQALKEKRMYDAHEIRDVISEADADNDDCLMIGRGDLESPFSPAMSGGRSISCCTVILVTGLNQQFGISNEWFAMGDSLIITVLSQASFMPVLVLAARLCPPGMEATLFATLMSISNAGSVTGGLIGAGMTQVLGVTRDSFPNLALLITI